jgi:hypothetical protein
MGWFKSLTKAVARLDRATNPIHKAFQDKATDQLFGGNQEKAISVVHGVGVTVLDIVGAVFGYPGVGSALNGTDQLQDGNTKGAIMSFASAAVQVGSSPNNSGWQSMGSGGTGAASTTTAAAASSPAASAAGDSTTFVAFEASPDYAAFFGPDKTVVGSGIYGYTGAAGSTVSGIPAGTYTIGTGGGIGIDFGTAMSNNIPNLTLKDIKNGAGFVKTAAGMYDLMNRDGSVRASYGTATGGQQVPSELINYLYTAPTNMGAIPSNRAADITGAALAAQQQASQAQQQAIVLAMLCGIALYFSGAFK